MTTTTKELTGELSSALTAPHSWEFGVELREVETTDSLSMLHGRAVPYNEVADIGLILESFSPGSLGKSARESAAALPLMLHHGLGGYTMPAGSIDTWEERADGLYGTWRLADEPEAQRAARLARDGHLNFLSIRFQPIGGRTTIVWPEDLPRDLAHHDKPWLQREQARLLEVSLTPTPAYNGATVSGVRNARRPVSETPGRDYWRDQLERLKGNR